MQMPQHRLQHTRRRKPALNQSRQQRLPAGIKPQRQKKRQQHPHRIQHAKKPPAHIAARLPHLRHGVQPDRRLSIPLDADQSVSTALAEMIAAELEP